MGLQLEIGGSSDLKRGEGWKRESEKLPELLDDDLAVNERKRGGGGGE